MGYGVWTELNWTRIEYSDRLMWTNQLTFRLYKRGRNSRQVKQLSAYKRLCSMELAISVILRSYKRPIYINECIPSASIPTADPIENIKRLHEIWSVLLPVFTAVTGVKALFKNSYRVFGCDTNPRSYLSFVLII
jgi:hypothetical protein